MAMKVRYNVVDGEIVSENRGGVKSFYVPDALGSTIAVTDDTGTVTDHFEYWPYGNVSSHAGSNPTQFLYCGTLGYLTVDDQIYVRFRFLDTRSCRWMTADPLLQKVLLHSSGSVPEDLLSAANLYEYADSDPTQTSDFNGLGGYITVDRLALNQCLLRCYELWEKTQHDVNEPWTNVVAGLLLTTCLGGCHAKYVRWVNDPNDDPNWRGPKTPVPKNKTIGNPRIGHPRPKRLDDGRWKKIVMPNPAPETQGLDALLAMLLYLALTKGVPQPQMNIGVIGVGPGGDRT